MTWGWVGGGGRGGRGTHLARGGLEVEHEFDSIECTLETRLRRVQRLDFGGERKRSLRRGVDALGQALHLGAEAVDLAARARQRLDASLDLCALLEEGGELGVQARCELAGGADLLHHLVDGEVRGEAAWGGTRHFFCSGACRRCGREEEGGELGWIG